MILSNNTESVWDRVRGEGREAVIHWGQMWGKYNNAMEGDHSHGVKLNFVAQKDKDRDPSFTIIV